MKLDQLFAMAGDHPLSSMDWGLNALALANAVLGDSEKLAASCTGKEAYTKLRSLPFDTMLRVLSQNVQLLGAQVVYVSPYTTGNQPTLPPNTPPSQLPPTVPNAGQKINPIVLVMVIVMGIITLGFSFTSMQVAKQTGTQPENETVVSMLRLMTDMVKEERQLSQQEKEQAQPAPTQDPVQ